MQGGWGQGLGPLILCISAQASCNLFTYFTSGKVTALKLCYKCRECRSKECKEEGVNEGGKGEGAKGGGAEQHAFKASELKLRCQLNAFTCQN